MGPVGVQALMAKKKREPAHLVNLSPSSSAVVYGAGDVRIFELGRYARAWMLSAREMQGLVETWLETEIARRDGLALSSPIDVEIARRIVEMYSADDAAPPPTAASS